MGDMFVQVHPNANISWPCIIQTPLRESMRSEQKL